MINTLGRLLWKIGYTYIVLIVFGLMIFGTSLALYEYTYGDIVYATIVEEPYFARRDCVLVLQYQEVKSTIHIGSWDLCELGKYKIGDTYPVKHLKGSSGFVKVHDNPFWFLIGVVIFYLYWIYYTIKLHFKFFRDEKEKEINEGQTL